MLKVSIKRKPQDQDERARKAYIDRGWWFGFIMYGCVRSLYADFIGQEEYVRMAQERWVSGAYTVPLALVLIALTMFARITVVRKGIEE